MCNYYAIINDLILCYEPSPEMISFTLKGGMNK